MEEECGEINKVRELSNDIIFGNHAHKLLCYRIKKKKKKNMNIRYIML